MKGEEANYIEDAIRDLDSVLEGANPSLEDKMDGLVYLTNALAQAVVLVMTGSDDTTIRSGGGALLAAVGVSMKMLYGKEAQRAFLDAWTGGEYSNVDAMKNAGVSNKDIEEFFKKGDKYEQ